MVRSVKNLLIHSDESKQLLNNYKKKRFETMLEEMPEGYEDIGDDED